MKPEAAQLRSQVRELETNLSAAQKKLNDYVAACPHKFAETYDPIRTPRYIIPGDPPGTMGVDWRGPVPVPAEKRDRWKRECLECGLVEYTELVEEKVNKKPLWRYGGNK